MIRYVAEITLLPRLLPLAAAPLALLMADLS
jgi:hypothetical protein